MQSISETIPEMTLKRKVVLLLISVLLMTASFPPLDLGFLAWIGLAPVFYLVVTETRPRKAFKWAYMFGILHWGWTIIWIAATVNAWTHSIAGWGAWIALTLLKSLWFGLFGWMAWWLYRARWKSLGPVCVGAAWTFMEWLRCQTGVAMPWSLSGYTQYRYLDVIQIADITGVFGITFLLAFLNMALVEIVLNCTQRKSTFKPINHIIRQGIVPISLVLACVAYGELRLHDIYTGSKTRISIIQPNDRAIKDIAPVPVDILMARATAAMERYSRMSDDAAKEHPDLIVWPESTSPLTAFGIPGIKKEWERIALASHAWHLVGTDNPVDEHHSYNSAAIFNSTGQLSARYDKTWLVPMGEWFPLRFIPGLQQAFDFPEDAAAGVGDQLMQIGPAKASVLICYESVFPVIARGRSARGANLLINITNDSWAGESSELQQHVAMSAMRCVETRRWMASSATTGITGFISPTGAIRGLAPYREGILTQDVTLLDGVTVYSRVGDTFVGLLVILMVACVLPLRKRTQEPSPPED
ncbi:MAG: apolipoprotein N-acyltransferase [Chthonomonadales bacterium]